VTQVRFICSVKRSTGCDETVSNEFFFGTGFLDYVDSLFFYLPFSSRGQAEKARAPSGTTDQEWAKLRTGLLQDHRNPENRPILIQAWKNYVATTFAQHAAGSAPEPQGVGDDGMCDWVDDDDIAVPAPPPPRSPPDPSTGPA
jgi:hypothetical protein